LPPARACSLARRADRPLRINTCRYSLRVRAGRWISAQRIGASGENRFPSQEMLKTL